ncbi:hypothetical protein [Kitasatospora sp. GAS204B]|uniref:Rv0361 family membrane protein n=1 Tax=unclassified Kitasatospora TaxID=2633591 RepID=UPI002476D714|nr:hypothetical protein [Kitasatospora sp. GAS204B]MDH6116284.1 hypothetical protein [Kitasatospora sp. GAS204B]
MTPNPERRPRKGPFVLGAAVLIVVTGGAIGYAQVQHAQVQHAHSDPVRIQQVVDQFATAVDRADVAKTVSLLCPEEANAITDSDIPPDSSQLATAKRPIKVSGIQVRGDLATAQVTRPGVSATLHLRKDAGTWKVCDPAATG